MTGLTLEQYLGLCTLDFDVFKGVKIDDEHKPKLSEFNGIRYSKLEYKALEKIKDKWAVIGFNSNTLSGMGAVAIQNLDTKEVVIAYRGTDAIERNVKEAIKDYETDLAIASGGNKVVEAGLNQFQDAYLFYECIKKDTGITDPSKITITGHSLGGGLAQYVAYKTKGQHQTTTFDAVGIGQVLPGVNPRDYDYSITDYVNENDIIGLYGEQLGRTVYIKDVGSSESQKRNRDVIILQRSTFRAINDAVKEGKLPDTMLQVAKYTSREMVRSMQNSFEDIILDPHRPSSLIDINTGKLAQRVSCGNPIVSALGKGTQVILKAHKDINDGLYFVLIEIPAAGVKTVISIGKTAINIVINTAKSVFKFACDVGDAVFYAINDAGAYLGNKATELVNSLLHQASTIPVRIDPIVLDLSGLGITTKSVADGVYYDMDNNGFLEKTGWVDAKSGILVLDKNGDGKIETGNELFGDRTILADGKTASSGFEALATLDSNHDGVIDAKDKLFSQLRIWIDRDGDGISDKGELITLAQAGIKSLSLKHKELNQLDANGNTVARVGAFTRTNGKVAEMKEYLLARSTSDVKMVNSINIPKDIMELPEIRPIGNTYSLRQAMARDKSGKLKQLVLSFTSEKNVAKRRAILEDILFTWTGVAKVDPASRGGLIDARRLAALEIVTGTNYRNSPTSSPTSQEAPILEQAYGNLAESIYNMLSLQDGTMDSILRKFTYHIDLSSDGNPIKLDIASVKAYLDGQLKQNRQEGERLLGEVTRILKNRGLVTEKEFSSLRDYYARKSAYYQKIIDTTPFTTARGTAKDDVMSGAVDRDNIIAGNYGDDTIYGSNGVNILYGEAGNDSLYGGSNNDTLIGGKGNDYLQGGYGNDTYIFSKGDGKDTIEDYDSTEGNLDTIRFGAGIKPADLIFIHPVCPPNVSSSDPSYVDENDLIIRFKNSPDDQITVKNYFSNYRGIDQTNNYAIERIEFTDSKAVLTAKDIIAQARIRHGTAKDDHIYGLVDDGNDTLIGGKGNDYLQGGYGNDTYIFSKGDGKDTIEDYDSTEGNLDTIRFGAGIKPADLIFKYVNNNLQISQHGSTDSVTVNSWQYGKSYQIENVRTANGSMITNTQVDKLIQAMATFQHDTGMSWEQALKSQPSKVQTILQDYWTIPSA